jgi:hypothetical protein
VSRSAISVLMPIAPRSPWLREALESLRCQAFTDWELVAVLDGHCDVNMAVLDGWELAKRTRVLQTEGGAGVARSLNLGLAACRAELVARHDADDLSAPGRLARQFQTMKASPSLAVLGTCARVINETGEVVGVRDAPGGRALAHRLRWRNALIHPSVVMRRSVILGLGGYDESNPRAEDYELWLRVAARSELDNLPERLVDYRVHQSQHSSGKDLGRGAALVRQTRRESTTARGGSALMSDLRHLAWLGVQVAHGRTMR